MKQRRFSQISDFDFSRLENTPARLRRINAAETEKRERKLNFFFEKDFSFSAAAILWAHSKFFIYTP